MYNSRCCIYGESLREYMQSDEYLKQAAKDRLGLVESDEVIFRPQD